MLRRVGIAIGSLAAAWLVISLVGGVLLPTGGMVAGLVTVVLGGLIYRDILRRERPG